MRNWFTTSIAATLVALCALGGEAFAGSSAADAGLRALSRVPSPSAYAMVTLMFAGLLAWRWRRRRASRRLLS